jgi:hypothetical protein
VLVITQTSNFASLQTFRAAAGAAGVAVGGGNNGAAGSAGQVVSLIL